MSQPDDALPTMQTSPDRRGVPLFLALAFGFSWLVAAAGWALGVMTPAVPGPFTVPALFLFMCGPAVAALVCAFTFDRGRVRATLGLRKPFNVWLVAAWLVPIGIVAVSLLLTLVLSGRSYQSPAVALEAAMRSAGQDPAGVPVDTLAMVQVLAALTVGSFINAPLSLSEELGWRGWLWSRWRPLGFWRCAALTGLVWGLWHAPIVALGHNYPDMPILGPVLMLGWCLLISPVLHLVRERGGSVWHAALFHGTINAVAGLSIVVMVDPSMPWRGALGIGGGMVLAVSVLVTWLLVERRR